jgi:hypothetical protein
MLPFSVWKEKPVNLLPGKRDITELSFASLNAENINFIATHQS